MRYALTLGYTCFVMLDPGGWLGFLSEPEIREYDVLTRFNVRESLSGTLTVDYQIESDDPAIESGFIGFKPGTWITYSCEGCEREWGECP